MDMKLESGEGFLLATLVGRVSLKEAIEVDPIVWTKIRQSLDGAAG